jgi:hypothetical protein
MKAQHGDRLFQIIERWRLQIARADVSFRTADLGFCNIGSTWAELDSTRNETGKCDGGGPTAVQAC